MRFPRSSMIGELSLRNPVGLSPAQARQISSARHTNVAIVDQVTRQVVLAATDRAVSQANGPLTSPAPGRNRTYGCGRRNRRVPARDCSTSLLGFAHSDDNVCAKFLRTENIFRASSMMSQYFDHLCGDCTPLPRVRSKTSGRRSVKGDSENISAEIFVFCTSVPRHCRRVRQYRYRDRLPGSMLVGPLLEHRKRVVLRARMRDHRNTHAVKRAILGILGNDVDDLAIGTAGQSTRMKLRSA